MSHSLLILICSSLASFIGSLQLGPVNMFVIDSTLTKNKKSAYLVAIGGCLPEFVYCGLAVFTGSLFLHHATIFFAFKVLLVVFMTVIGCFYLLKKPVDKVNSTQPPARSYFGNFLKGFSLAILNPQLLPFWLFMMVYFQSINFLEIKSLVDKFAYIAGAGLGAFALLALIISTIEKFKTKITVYLNNKYYNKFIALLFFAIAIQQLISILNERRN